MALYRFWVYKEAILKAFKKGFLISPHCVEFKIQAGGGVEVLSLPDFAGKIEDWSLHFFAPQNEFLCAIALNLPSLKVQQFTLHC